MNKPKGFIGWAYVRVSDGSKQDHESQRDSIARWAKSLGLQIVRWFIDSGSRHKAEKRAEFQRMMALLGTEKPDFIAVDARTRFGGKPGGYEYGGFVDRIRKAGVELWSVLDGLLSGTDDLTVIKTAVGSLTVTKESKERAERS